MTSYDAQIKASKRNTLKKYGWHRLPSGTWAAPKQVISVYTTLSTNRAWRIHRQVLASGLDYGQLARQIHREFHDQAFREAA